MVVLPKVLKPTKTFAYGKRVIKITSDSIKTMVYEMMIRGVGLLSTSL